MHILGISCYYHDAAAAILRDGQLVAAAEEERFSRVKHDFGFPKHAIEFCLREAKIDAKDVDYVVFYERPFRKLDRLLISVLQTYPQSWKVFRESMIGWMLDKLWIASTLQSELGVSRDRVLFSEHHLSHAASAFLCSPFEESAILTVDGVGEWLTAACGVGRGTQIQLTKQIEFPHSIGLLYSAFTAFLGFEVNEGEYKVMGMAPYGTPRYVDKVWKTVKQNEDGSFSLDMDYFCFHYATDRMYTPKLVELFGEPRPRETPFFTESTGFPKYFGKKPADYIAQCRVNEHYADIAASIQRVTEDLLVGIAQNLHKQTGLKKLCVAGRGGGTEGGLEWGPGGLGQRSILADPRGGEMKDIVNSKIKSREPYRPFAPSVIAEAAPNYFELGDAVNQYPLRYMLYVTPVKPEHHATLPAITHVDGSARVQTVYREQSPLYYGLIERFGQATGVPVVLNTSFNLRGEPIVTTPANAYSTFSRSQMDCLVLGNFLIEKPS